MYRQKAFQVDDPAVLYQFVAAHPLATLISAGEQGIQTTQVPLIHRERDGEPILIGHLARSNPQWQSLNVDADAVALFLGARHYITPVWYPSDREHGRVVPTYDYVAVEARGSVRVIHESESLRAFVSALTDQEEDRIGGSWSAAAVPAAFMDSQLAAIVGVELRVTGIMGSFKLSQNRSAADVDGVVEGLRSLGTPAASSIAAMIAAARRPDESLP
ncbi:MAG: FMN-binding negative transcriptional regulator [Vulcanimicrobiaceae bacterium]